MPYTHRADSSAEIEPGGVVRQAEEKKHIGKTMSDILKKIVPDLEPSPIRTKEDPVIMISVMIDDSWSIEEHGNTKRMINAHDKMIKALNKAEDYENIVFSSQLMKKPKALNNWLPMDYVTPLTEENYQPDGLTPLYDATVKLVGSSETHWLKARLANKRARFSALVISDGEDTSSVRYPEAEDVKKVITNVFSQND